MSVIALIEPDDAVRARLHRVLGEAELVVVEAAGGLEALRVVFETRPQACLLGAQAPGIDGVELVRLLTVATDVPIVVIVGESDPVVTASLLDAGAADVVTLATGSAELIARLRSLMRSRRRRLRGHTGEGTIRTGGIAIDRIAQTVTKHGVRVTLSTAEYRLVDALASRIDQITPYRVLLSTVWGEAYVDDAHYLRIYISYLRSKLEDDPARPVYIVHEQGAGYRLAKRPLWTEG